MKPVVAGMGRLVLDVIRRSGQPLHAQAGGTCGNVLAVLAWLGWHARAVGLLGADVPGTRIRADLERFGVDVSLVERSEGVESPVVVHEIIDKIHSFSRKCPHCSRDLPDVEPPRPPLLLPGRGQALFFDQDSEAALLSARRWREAGSLVMWEPSYAGPEVAWEESLAVAHVLKYSREQLPGMRERIGKAGPRLVIETDGERGLNWRLGGTWRHLPAIQMAVIRDTGGAGDWTTAGFLDAFAGWEDEKIEQALRRGQAMGAWACSFEGARGGMYAATHEEFDQEITALLAGQLVDPGASRMPCLEPAGRFCRCLAPGT